MAVKQINYRPSKTLAKFHADRSFVRGVMGPYGSGKSVGMCMEALSIAREQEPDTTGWRKTRGAIIRNSYGELRSTTQATWTDWFPTETFGPIRRGSGPDIHVVTLPKEKIRIEVLFLAMDRPDDAAKVLSLELTWAWINEAREMAWKVIEAVMGRVGRYPKKERDAHGGLLFNGATWSGIFMDTNPPSSRSWWFRKFETERPRNWQIFKQPSGLSEDAENIENLPENYYKNMMTGMDELAIRCHIHGEYSFLKSGSPVYTQFKYSLHVASEPITPYPRQTILVGIDVGRSPGVVFAQHNMLGGLMVLSEITATDTAADTLTGLIKNHLNRHYPGFKVEYHCDPAFTQGSQAKQHETVATILWNAGIHARGTQTNSLAVRIEAVRQLLHKLDAAGEPLLMIDPQCEALIEAMAGGYHFKEEVLPGDRIIEEPVKDAHSHIADALQYLVLGAGFDPRVPEDGTDTGPTPVRGITARRGGMDGALTRRRTGRRL